MRAKPTLISNRNVLVVDTDPKFAGVEKLIPATWADPQFFNGSGSKPGQAANADHILCFSGNRIFIRTLTHLYAVGDPKTTWK